MQEPVSLQPEFEGFYGSLSHLQSTFVPLDVSAFVPVRDEEGIKVLNGINLTHHLEPLHLDILNPLLPRKFRHFPSLLSGLSGRDAQKVLNLYGAVVNDMDAPEILIDDSELLQSMVFNLYWIFLRQMVPQFNSQTSREDADLYLNDHPYACSRCSGKGCEVDVNPGCAQNLLGRVQTFMLGYVIEQGFNNHRHLNPLLRAIGTADIEAITGILLNQMKQIDYDSPSAYCLEWNKRRCRDICFILEIEPLVNGTLGQGAENNADDLSRVAQRLNDLGYLDGTELTVTSTSQDANGDDVNEYDFAPLTQFLNIVNGSSTTPNVLYPGSREHLYLLSPYAPRWENLSSNLVGVDVTAVTSLKTTSWVNDALHQLSEDYQRILKAEKDLAGASPLNIVIQHITDNGDRMVVALPSESEGVNVSVGDPEYSEVMMKLFLRAFVKNSLVPNSTYLHIADPVLARGGFCTLRPHNSDVVVSQQQLFVRFEIPELKFQAIPLIPQTGDDQSDDSTQNTTNPIESVLQFMMSKYTPDDEDGTFDYYFSCICENWDSLSIPPTTFPQDTVMILGIRGWTLHRPRVEVWDNWCDSIILLWIDDNNKKRCESFVAATRPGKLRGFDNIRGDAHLECGQYSYIFDKPANPKKLIPSNGVSIRRDPIKRGSPDSSLPLELGSNEIFIGDGGNNSSKVGRCSRGAQVILNVHENGIQRYDEFMQILIANHTGSSFLYTLISSNGLEPHDADAGGDD
jgi:hypothetical protein